MDFHSHMLMGTVHHLYYVISHLSVVSQLRSNIDQLTHVNIVGQEKRWL